MKTYPIFFKLNEFVPGNGFFATVALSGRALAVEEAPGEWWAYGVNPGAIAGHGATIIEAFADIQQNFRRYLADQAEAAPTFAALRTEIARFFRECDVETRAEWEAAVAAMKAGADAPKGIGKQETESAHCGIEVVELGVARPSTEEIRDVVLVAA